MEADLSLKSRLRKARQRKGRAIFPLNVLKNKRPSLWYQQMLLGVIKCHSVSAGKGLTGRQQMDLQEQAGDSRAIKQRTFAQGVSSEKTEREGGGKRKIEGDTERERGRKKETG